MYVYWWLLKTHVYPEQGIKGVLEIINIHIKRVLHTWFTYSIVYLNWCLKRRVFYVGALFALHKYYKG